MTELILNGMPLEVYESFDQVVVPILQSRVNSTIQVAKRQTLVYGEGGDGTSRVDMKITAGVVNSPEMPSAMGGASPVPATTPVEESPTTSRAFAKEGDL